MLARSFLCVGGVEGEGGRTGFPVCAGEQLSRPTITCQLPLEPGSPLSDIITRVYS